MTAPLAGSAPSSSRARRRLCWQAKRQAPVSRLRVGRDPAVLVLWRYAAKRANDCLSRSQALEPDISAETFSRNYFKVDQ